MKIKGEKVTAEKEGEWYVLKFATEKSKRYEILAM